MGRKPTNITIEKIREQNRLRAKRYYHKHHVMNKCYLHDHQVCDICQKVNDNKGVDDEKMHN